VGSAALTLQLLALLAIAVAVIIIIWLKTPADMEASAGLE